jgi:iron(III) transport system permease protein
MWRRVNPWAAGAVLVGAMLALPALVVFGALFVPGQGAWGHLYQTVLRDYLLNTLWLALGVGAGTLIIGVGCAWLITLCRFPGRRVFEWALLLPLAMPAYIIAYTYTGLLDFAGPLQSQLRALTGWGYGDYWFPQVRSLGGAALMLTLVLYPYVYLLARAAFLEQSATVLEVSRSLGCGSWCGFWRVALPLARPGIVAGVSLALMETLADYGTMQYFGVSTFTTGIFRTWFGMGDQTAAAQLAAMLLGLVFLLIALEHASRRRARFHHASASRPLPGYPLRGTLAALAFLACLLPLLFGFLIPAGQLSAWAWQTAPRMLDAEFARLAWHSLALAGGTALLALLVALFLGYGRRLAPHWPVRLAVRLAGMGYAIPGTVIAIGILLPFVWLDNLLDGFSRAYFGLATGLLLSGTLIALLSAYLVRFLAVSLQTVEAGLGRIRPTMDDAARSLGLRPAQVLGRVHIPILRGSLLTALLLVFVDVMKELPATLVLRPFNFNTLAVRAFELASDERLADSATAALSIVLAGLLPVILLSRTIAGRRRDTAEG